jgi:hypothetical protein
MRFVGIWAVLDALRIVVVRKTKLAEDGVNI